MVSFGNHFAYVVADAFFGSCKMTDNFCTGIEALQLFNIIY